MTALWALAWAYWLTPTLWWCELVLRAANDTGAARSQPPHRHDADIIDMAQWAASHHRAHPHGGHAA